MSNLRGIFDRLDSLESLLSSMRPPSSTPSTLASRDLAGVAAYMLSPRCKNIVVLTGAGISTSAGLPDFRSPGTGLYANLARLNLPYPEAVFDISFFRQHPAPFYLLAKELYPGNFRPTVTHSFIKLLADKGKLRKHFTQNIDCLDREAGLPGDLIVEAHGSFASQACIECKRPFPRDTMVECVNSMSVAKCKSCNGLVKPEITFFGEALPAAFWENRHLVAEADLIICIGSSLTVQPFASLPSMARDGVPRVLINMEEVGGIGNRGDDVLLLGDADTQVRKLSRELGWAAELEAAWKQTEGKYPSEGTAKKVEEEEAGTATRDAESEVEKLTKELDEHLQVSRDHVAREDRELKDESRKRGDDGSAAGSGDPSAPKEGTAASTSHDVAAPHPPANDTAMQDSTTLGSAKAATGEKGRI